MSPWKLARIGSIDDEYCTLQHELGLLDLCVVFMSMPVEKSLKHSVNFICKIDDSLINLILTGFTPHKIINVVSPTKHNNQCIQN